MRLTDEQIGAELHSLRPTPDANFSAKLDGRAAAGFPSSPKPKTSDRELTWARLLPALGVLATFAVLVVVISNIGGSRSADQDGALLERTPSETVAPGGPAQAKPGFGFQTGADSGTAAALPPTQPAPGSRPRNGHAQVQERTAQVGLATD